MNEYRQQYYLLNSFPRKLLLLLSLTMTAHAQIVEKAKLISPADSMTDQPLTLMMQWQSASGASSYELQISENSQFTATVYNQTGITETSREVSSLQREKQYFWRVRGFFLDISGAWSDTWSFTTIPNPPLPPVLSAPINYSINQPTALILNWNNSQQPVSYHAQIASDSLFTKFLKDTTVGFSNLLSLQNLKRDVKYFWRVQGSNPGGTSSWSTIFQFSTVPPPPPAPELLSPVNNALNQLTALTLVWSSTIQTTQYHVQLSLRSDFSTLMFNDSTLNDTTLQLGLISRDEKYYWRVRSINPGGTGAWSAVFQFSTVPTPPPTPELLSPANNAFNQPTSLTLVWNSTIRTTQYHVQLSLRSDFSTLMFNDSTLNDTTLQSGLLSRDEKYYWRVRSINPGGTGTWSAVFQFSTVPTPSPTPSVLSPANNAFNQSVALALVWSSTARTNAYHVQLSLHSDFSVLILNDSSMSDTVQQMKSLLHDTVYYWRVRSINSGGASGWSTASLFRTMPKSPSIVTLRLPMNGGYNQPLAAQLHWSPADNAASYHVQVSLRSDFSTRVIDNALVNDTTLRIESLLNDTVYYWRIAGLNNGGKSAWSAVWTFATIPLRPSVPTIASPANNSMIDTNVVLLSWNTVQKSSAYWLQLSQDSTFGTILTNDSAIVSASYKVSNLKFNEKYFWRVRAMNAGGNSQWSSVYSFITRSTDSYAGPELESPTNGAENQPHTITLRWKPVLTALSYQIQISRNNDFSSLINESSSLLTTAIQIDALEGNTTYYWRVRSAYILFTSDWSPVWSFTTIPNFPSIPVLTSPLNNSANNATTVRFIWNPTPAANTYQLQVSTDQNFSALIVNDASITDTVCQIASLAEETKYYWRVASINNGGKSSWSTVWTFTTIKPVPPSPVPVYPLSGLQLDSNSVIIEWNPVQNVATYCLQLANDSGFTTIVFNDSTISSTSKKITGLLGSTLYFWRVRSHQSQTNSEWSKPISFKTGASSSAGPSLTSPADNSTNQPTTITLRWNTDPSASSYHVQVSKTMDFSSVVFENASVSNPSVQISSLGNSTSYYWHVRSNYFLLSSDWSAAWKFTTIPKTPNAPALIAPTNGATDQPLVTTLRWSTSIDTLQYHLQIASDSAFAVLKENDSTLTASSKKISSLRINRSYYWRVRAGKDKLWSDFSSPWKFTTKAGDLPTAKTENASDLTSTTAKLKAIVSANGYATTIRFQYGTTIQYGNSVDGIPLTIDDTSTAKIITNTLHGLTPNTTYHYRVSTTNQLGSTEGEDQSFTTLLPQYPGSFGINTTFSFPLYKNPSDYKPSDYQIIGLPGNSNIKIDSLLSGIQRSDWETYWDNGDGERTLISFDGSRNFSFSTGRAFWFIKKGPLTIQTNAPTAALDSLQEILVPLHPGWNLITNPFDSVIAWSRLQAVNSINQPLYSFDKNFVLSDMLRPYVGYYFFNDSGKTNLRVPYTAIFEVPSNIASSTNLFSKSSQISWNVSITMKSGDAVDQSTWFGVKPSSGIHQFHKPAGFDMFPAVYFDRPDWDSRHRTFATDFRPSFRDKQLWNFTVWNTTRQKTELMFSGIQSIPEQFQIYLINPKASQTINLRTDSIYNFSPAERTTTLSIIIGTSDSIQSFISSIRPPETFALGNNYPNPFNPETNIPVSIPIRSLIQLSVFNILGQKIQDLYSGMLDPGNYWFRWDGKNSNGNKITSGIYIYQLKGSNGISIAKKMVFNK